MNSTPSIPPDNIIESIQSDASNSNSIATTSNTILPPLPSLSNNLNELEQVSTIIPKKRGRRSVTFANQTNSNGGLVLEKELVGAEEVADVKPISTKFTEEEILTWRNSQIDARQAEVSSKPFDIVFKSLKES